MSAWGNALGVDRDKLCDVYELVDPTGRRWIKARNQSVEAFIAFTKGAIKCGNWGAPWNDLHRSIMAYDWSAIQIIVHARKLPRAEAIQLKRDLN